MSVVIVFILIVNIQECYHGNHSENSHILKHISLTDFCFCFMLIISFLVLQFLSLVSFHCMQVIYVHVVWTVDF